MEEAGEVEMKDVKDLDGKWRKVREGKEGDADVVMEGVE